MLFEESFALVESLFANTLPAAVNLSTSPFSSANSARLQGLPQLERDLRLPTTSILPVPQVLLGRLTLAGQCLDKANDLAN
jgi:hypothetical protein